ncbi:hypothetical protein AB0M95_05105 [Sphaerisporangium sp. NPDC051017]|uniref:hypothetical protein n=1 Tax=Sphaerisporangium sp. NPDC051017 TaxID=3154636 RepID=UPI0034349605
METTPGTPIRPRGAEARAAGFGLDEVPAEIRGPGPRLVDLAWRRLTALPPSIATLSGPEVLRLDGNRLTGLPPEVARLRGLREIHLDGNALDAIFREAE